MVRKASLNSTGALNDEQSQVQLLGRNIAGTRYVKVMPPPSPLSTPPTNGLCPQKTLETFYGIGPHVSARLLARLSIHPTARLRSLSNATILDITAELTSLKIENDLRRELRDNIRRLKDMGTYRGRRHALGMPVRGQRTRNQTVMANYWNRVERVG